MNTYLHKIWAKFIQLFQAYHSLFIPLSIFFSCVAFVCIFVLLTQEIRNTNEGKSNEEVIVEHDVVLTDELSQKVSDEVYVDVSGGVVSPGVIKALDNSRISDVILLAGGFSDTADLSKVSKSINLAKKVSDGEKIVIPVFGQENEVKEEQVSINDANASQLQTLKGIGQVRAEDIIAGRPYSSIEELINRNILPLTVFEGIKAKLEL